MRGAAIGYGNASQNIGTKRHVVRRKKKVPATQRGKKLNAGVSVATKRLCISCFVKATSCDCERVSAFVQGKADNGFGIVTFVEGAAVLLANGANRGRANETKNLYGSEDTAGKQWRGQRSNRHGASRSEPPANHPLIALTEKATDRFHRPWPCTRYHSGASDRLKQIRA